jgi:hypothetical protein
MSSTPPAISLKNSKLASPFSLRLTFKERTILEQAAGDMPLGAYIRSKLLNESEVPRRVRKRTRKPLKDEQALALLLGELGKARIANNLNQLAKAVNTGSLPVTPDTEKPSRGHAPPCRICGICSCRLWVSLPEAYHDPQRKSALRRQRACEPFAPRR